MAKGSSVDVNINGISPVIDIGADVLVAGYFISVDYDTAESSTGDLYILDVFRAANALTLGGDLYGINLNFNSNVTMATERDVYGYTISTGALTQSAANTTKIYGFTLPTAGALVQNTAAGVLESGVEKIPVLGQIVKPALFGSRVGMCNEAEAAQAAYEGTFAGFLDQYCALINCQGVTGKDWTKYGGGGLPWCQWDDRGRRFRPTRPASVPMGPSPTASATPPSSSAFPPGRARPGPSQRECRAPTRCEQHAAIPGFPQCEPTLHRCGHRSPCRWPSPDSR